MRFLGICFSDSVGLMVELDDLVGLFQLKRFCDSLILQVLGARAGGCSQGGSSLVCIGV